VTAAEYESYFAAILDHGDRLGVHFTGLTWPGCGCPACNTRYEALYNQSITTPNQAVWQALLNLVDAGRFRGPALPCFFGEDLPEAAPHLMASSGGSAIYTLPPNAGDRFGVWLNDPRYVNPDYYISANGQAGRIVELVRAGAPYCIFFTHWQGLNPANGVGWQAFTQVIQRVQKHLHRQVEWMRPSQYTTLLLGQPSDN
jgi:hypothetical protein